MRVSDGVQYLPSGGCGAQGGGFGKNVQKRPPAKNTNTNNTVNTGGGFFGKKKKTRGGGGESFEIKGSHVGGGGGGGGGGVGGGGVGKGKGREQKCPHLSGGRNKKKIGGRSRTSTSR